VRVIFDTNVLVAAFISEGLCSKLLRRANRRDFDLYSSPFIVSEFQKAFKTKIGLRESEITILTGLLIELVMLVTPGEEEEQQAKGFCRDKQDDQVLACALACRADYLVTGDQDLLEIKKFHRTRILSPREFELLFY